jgi:hypothetical protein
MSALRAMRLVFACLLFAFLAYLALVTPQKATAKPDDFAVHDGTPSDRA